MGSLSMRNKLLQNSLMLGIPVGWGADHPTLQVSQQRGQDRNPSPGWHLHVGVLPSPFSPEYCGPSSRLPPSMLLSWYQPPRLKQTSTGSVLRLEAGNLGVGGMGFPGPQGRPLLWPVLGVQAR